MLRICRGVDVRIDARQQPAYSARGKVASVKQAAVRRRLFGAGRILVDPHRDDWSAFALIILAKWSFDRIADKEVHVSPTGWWR